MASFELYRRSISGSAVAPLWVVEHLDVVEDIGSRVIAGRIDLAADAFALRRGVCQDYAHIFIACARSAGVPARYVSGHLLRSDGIVAQDAGHAWAEAHVEKLGWVGFDISNGISPDERYVRVATGRDYREAAPVTGLSWGAGETRLAVKLAVEQQSQEQ